MKVRRDGILDVNDLIKECKKELAPSLDRFSLGDILLNFETVTLDSEVLLSSIDLSACRSQNPLIITTVSFASNESSESMVDALKPLVSDLSAKLTTVNDGLADVKDGLSKGLTEVSHGLSSVSDKLEEQLNKPREGSQLSCSDYDEFASVKVDYTILDFTKIDLPPVQQNDITELVRRYYLFIQKGYPRDDKEEFVSYGNWKKSSASGCLEGAIGEGGSLELFQRITKIIFADGSVGFLPQQSYNVATYNISGKMDGALVTSNTEEIILCEEDKGTKEAILQLRCNQVAHAGSQVVAVAERRALSYSGNNKSTTVYGLLNTGHQLLLTWCVWRNGKPSVGHTSLIRVITINNKDEATVEEKMVLAAAQVIMYAFCAAKRLRAAIKAAAESIVREIEEGDNVEDRDEDKLSEDDDETDLPEKILQINISEDVKKVRSRDCYLPINDENIRVHNKLNKGDTGDFLRRWIYYS